MNRSRIIAPLVTVVLGTAVSAAATQTSWRIPEFNKPACHGGFVALTIDDGPSASSTDILDLLDRHNLVATHFVVGDHVATHPAVVRRMLARGDQLGYHTSHHTYLPEMSTPDLVADIQSFQKTLNANIPGAKTAFMRPPFGGMDERVRTTLHSQGGQVALWDVDTRDYEPGMTGRRAAAEIKHARDGDVILMHDAGSPTSVDLIPEMVAVLKDKGLCTAPLGVLEESRDAWFGRPHDVAAVRPADIPTKRGRGVPDAPLPTTVEPRTVPESPTPSGSVTP